MNNKPFQSKGVSKKALSGIPLFTGFMILRSYNGVPLLSSF
jgi:hypothetical protein